MDREKLYGGLSTSLLKFVRHLILGNATLNAINPLLEDFILGLTVYYSQTEVIAIVRMEYGIKQRE